MPVTLSIPAPRPMPNSHNLRITMVINEMISKISHLNDHACHCHTTREDSMPKGQDSPRSTFESSAIGDRLAAHVDAVAEGLEAIRRATSDQVLGSETNQDPSNSLVDILPLEVTDTARSLRRVGRRLMLLAAEIDLADRTLLATRAWQDQVGKRMSDYLDDLQRVVDLAAAGGLPL